MVGTYNPALVALSIIVAIYASFVALDLSSRLAVTVRSRRGKWLWLTGGALSMGAGIWSMHFIGMLAFQTPMHVAYDFWLTLFSLLIGIAASAISLTMAWRKTLGKAWLVGSGVFLGLGISAMHYTGMAAMRMEPAPQLNPRLVVLSIFIGILGSTIGVWTAFTLRYEPFFAAFWKRVGSAVVTGSAICGMHYVGMAAETYSENCVSTVSYFKHLDPSALAYLIGIITLLFLGATLLISAFDVYQLSRTSTQARDLIRANKRLAVEIKMRSEAESGLKRTSEELVRSNASLAQFAYVASHDLQEPIRTVQSYLTLLERENVGKLDNRSREFLEIAKGGASRMKHLIRDLLLYAKVGAEPPRPTIVDMNVVLGTVRLVLKTAIEEAEAEIVSEPLPTVVADQLQLERLLQNLLANAVNFRKPDVKPRVKVTARDLRDEWLFCVQDNGIGFEMEQASFIFGEFRRLRGEGYRGSGLGLAISEKIVVQHSGRIWAESSPGEGAAFFFTLPNKDCGGNQVA